jgi:hypothetical protein
MTTVKKSNERRLQTMVRPGPRAAEVEIGAHSAVPDFGIPAGCHAGSPNRYRTVTDRLGLTIQRGLPPGHGSDANVAGRRPQGGPR